MEEKARVNKKEIGIYFVVCALILLLVSHNSFLYSINDTEDINCFGCI